MKNQNQIQCVFVNPTDGESVTEVGTATLSVESNIPAIQAMFEDFDLQEAFEAFIQNQFCTEGGKAMSAEIRDALVSSK
jgi:hypothetical protein